MVGDVSPSHHTPNIFSSVLLDNLNDLCEEWEDCSPLRGAASDVIESFQHSVSLNNNVIPTNF